ncbi:MAG: SUMF1/EgtB/PvdO family nonheme iron enzyme [Paracoccaceae bacterium]
MHRFILALALAIAMHSLPNASVAEQRLALVIGNGAYAFSPLPNPVNDADSMTQALEQTGFDVTQATDVGLRAFKTAVSNFAQRVRNAGPEAVALFYFAGHGVQINGRNLLLPVDAEFSTATDLQYSSVEAQWVLDLIGESRAQMSVIILDACRNNPFVSSSRSLQSGLARMDAPRGSILAYSTAPGEIALDGNGRNSPYSEALAQQILTPGLKIEEMFKNVRRQVLSTTGEKQVPWESSSLIGDFYFAGAGAGVAASASAGTGSVVAARPLVTAPRTTSVAPGNSFRDCPDCPEMISIPAGSFQMGGEGDERGNGRVPVSLDGFALSRTEVTRAQFARFVQETGRDIEPGCWHWWGVWLFDGGRTWRDPGFPQTDSHPVVCNTYADARAFTDWLTAKSGMRYRLPSEAEWEYAASAGTGKAPWGDNVDLACADANVHDAQGATVGVPLSSSRCDDGYVWTAPVGSFNPNAFGLYDMMGNGWEMVDDCWNSGHQNRPATGASRTSGDCNMRIYKGSNVANFRDSYVPQHRFAGVGAQPGIYGGFRVARDLN